MESIHCQLCGSPETARDLSLDTQLYEVDCPLCKSYAIAVALTQSDLNLSANDLETLSAAASIHWEKNGIRLSITQATVKRIVAEFSSEVTEAIDTIREAEAIEDEALEDEVIAPIQYEVSSYGADYDVEGLVRRLERGDILIPPFQRAFVWNEAEASRFIESLLLGLPVPGIFLAKEPKTNQLLVIDGQQRLKSLLFFYLGEFNPRQDAKRKTVFRLSKVQPVFLNCTYSSLSDKDKRRLGESIVHATVIKQEYPEGDDTSIYHVFERLNNGGRKLTAQEIRTAIFHGPFMELLLSLNMDANWRAIFGPPSKRLKDQEMILRLLAFHFNSGGYAKPMTEFLNQFASTHRKPTDEFLESSTAIFTRTIAIIWKALGRSAFRIEGPLNVAVFDAVSYGVSLRLAEDQLSEEGLQSAYLQLLASDAFKKLVGSGTSDENNVETRLALSRAAFESVK